MRKNNKSVYLIIALVCLILLNVGSLMIQLNRNYVAVSKEDSSKKLLPSFSIKKFIENLFNIKDWKFFDDTRKMKGNSSEDVEHSLEKLEDFIIIDTLEEYENLIIVKDSTGGKSIEGIPGPINVKNVQVDDTKPYVFIYHTHATEGYLPFDDESYYSTNNEKNVVRVGETLTKVLEASDHKVIHEKEHHDRPSFNQSYSRSLNTANKAKEQEKNLRFFFDLHRDGVEKDSPYYANFVEKSKIKIDDVDVATFALVIGPKASNYDEVLSFAKYIKAVSDALYPGLCKGIVVKPYGKFNLEVSDYAALFEIGSNVNTVDEANESAKRIGEIIDLVINNIKE